MTRLEGIQRLYRVRHLIQLEHAEARPPAVYSGSKLEQFDRLIDLARQSDEDVDISHIVTTAERACNVRPVSQH